MNESKAHALSAAGAAGESRAAAAVRWQPTLAGRRWLTPAAGLARAASARGHCAPRRSPAAAARSCVALLCSSLVVVLLGAGGAARVLVPRARVAAVRPARGVRGRGGLGARSSQATAVALPAALVAGARCVSCRAGRRRLVVDCAPRAAGDRARGVAARRRPGRARRVLATCAPSSAPRLRASARGAGCATPACRSRASTSGWSATSAPDDGARRRRRPIAPRASSPSDSCATGRTTKSRSSSRTSWRITRTATSGGRSRSNVASCCGAACWRCRSSCCGCSAGAGVGRARAIWRRCRSIALVAGAVWVARDAAAARAVTAAGAARRCVRAGDDRRAPTRSARRSGGWARSTWPRNGRRR